MTTESGVILTRQQILDAQTVKTETVHVPEWGGFVVVRELTAAQVNEIGLLAIMGDQAIEISGDGKQAEQSIKQISMSLDSGGVSAMFPRIAAWCIVDPDTLEPVLTLAEVNRLSGQSSAALQRIAITALTLSGVLQEGDESETPAKNQ